MKIKISVFVNLLIVAAWLAWPTHVYAVKLFWQANSESDLAGYKVYRCEVGVACDSGIMTADVALETKYDLSPTWEGAGRERQWYVTAYDQKGNESGPSNVVQTDFSVPAPTPEPDPIDTTAPTPPIGLRIGELPAPPPGPSPPTTSTLIWSENFDGGNSNITARDGVLGRTFYSTSGDATAAGWGEVRQVTSGCYAGDCITANAIAEHNVRMNYGGTGATIGTNNPLRDAHTNKIFVRYRWKMERGWTDCDPTFGCDGGSQKVAYNCSNFAAECVALLTQKRAGSSDAVSYYSAEGTCPSRETYISGPDLEDGQWHLFELLWTFNTGDNCDGNLEFWIDGVQKIDASGVRFQHNSKADRLRIVHFHACRGGDCTTGSRIWHLDDFEVHSDCPSDAPSGC